jgi:hypothetical protein
MENSKFYRIRDFLFPIPGRSFSIEGKDSQYLVRIEKNIKEKHGTCFLSGENEKIEFEVKINKIVSGAPWAFLKGKALRTETKTEFVLRFPYLANFSFMMFCFFLIFLVTAYFYTFSVSNLIAIILFYVIMRFVPNISLPPFLMSELKDYFRKI